MLCPHVKQATRSGSKRIRPEHLGQALGRGFRGTTTLGPARTQVRTPLMRSVLTRPRRSNQARAFTSSPTSNSFSRAQALSCLRVRGSERGPSTVSANISQTGSSDAGISSLRNPRAIGGAYSKRGSSRTPITPRLTSSPYMPSQSTQKSVCRPLNCHRPSSA